MVSERSSSGSLLSMTGEDLIKFFDQHRECVPGTADPSGLFFLHACENFVTYWHDNLKHMLRVYYPEVSHLPFLFSPHTTKDTQIDSLSPDKLYQALMRITVESARKLCTDERFLKIFERTKRLKQLSTKAQQTASQIPAQVKSQSERGKKRKFEGTSIIENEDAGLSSSDGAHVTCTRCAELPEDERCIRKLYVDRYSDPSSLKGVVLTMAAEGDRLEPRVRTA